MSPRLEIAEAAAQAVLSEQSVTPNFALYAKAGLALLAVQVGDQIPDELFRATAEVLAFVFQLKQRRAEGVYS